MSVTPDGQRIAEIRKGKGLGQKTLASKAAMSERLLRDIERNNLPTAEYRLNNIAKVLGVDPDSIRQTSSAKFEPDWYGLDHTDSPSKIKLVSIDNSKDLYDLAESCDKMHWSFNVSPTMETARIMESILKIVERLAVGKNNNTEDEYDINSGFSNLFRIAKLGELMIELKSNKINLLSNIYYYRDEDDKDKRSSAYHIIHISFEDHNTTEKILNVWRGSYYREKYKSEDLPF